MEDAMIAQAKEIVAKSRGMLMEDLAGVTALFLGLFAVLSF